MVVWNSLIISLKGGPTINNKTWQTKQNTKKQKNMVFGVDSERVKQKTSMNKNVPFFTNCFRLDVKDSGSGVYQFIVGAPLPAY